MTYPTLYKSQAQQGQIINLKIKVQQGHTNQSTKSQQESTTEWPHKGGTPY